MGMNRKVWIKVIALDMLMLCFSFNVSVIGQMFDSIKNIYHLNYTQASMLLSVQSIGGLALAVMSILYIDRLNKNKILVICGLLLCILLIIIGVLPQLFFMFIIFIMLGFSGGAINTLSNPVMVETVPNKAERYINFMHMIFSFGAVVAPILSQMIYSAYGFSVVFYILGGFALLWAIYAAFAFLSQMKVKLKIEKTSFKQRLIETVNVFKKPGMKQIFFIAIMITSWQLSAIYYLSSYFTGLSQNSINGAIALSVLFLGMMISRLLYARIADRFSPGRVLIASNFLGFFAWILVFILQPIIAKTIMVGLSAMFCANNFPIAFSTACKIAPKNTATSSGLVTLGYYIAIFAFIPIVGLMGDMIGLNASLLFAGFPLILIIPTSFILYKRMKHVVLNS